MSSVKPFKLENQRSNLCKKKKQTLINCINKRKNSEYQVPDFRQVQSNAADLNILSVDNLNPNMRQCNNTTKKYTI